MGVGIAYETSYTNTHLDRNVVDMKTRVYEVDPFYNDGSVAFPIARTVVVVMNDFLASRTPSTARLRRLEKIREIRCMEPTLSHVAHEGASCRVETKC